MEMMSTITVSTPEEFWFEGANNDQVHGYYLPPVGMKTLKAVWPSHSTKIAPSDPKDSKSVPLAFLIHGGPQVSCIAGAFYSFRSKTMPLGELR